MNLRLLAPIMDSSNTKALRAHKKLSAKNDGTLASAIVSAGYYAKKYNQKMFVYIGNSYGHEVWRVSRKKSEYLNTINNTGLTMYSVDPDLTIFSYDVRR